MNSKYSANFVFFRYNTLSVGEIELLCEVFLACLEGLCTNSASYEYKNKSASNGAHRYADCLLKYPTAKLHKNIVD